MKKFPDGFLFGAATSAFQVEGGIENNDWAEAARQGKVPPLGQASDHYRRFEEDFDIAKSLGHNAHRFSIEWARIEPEEGKFDQKEIEHYKAVVKALRARGIEPFVTLWHFSLPVWFARSGSFGRFDAPQIFARYAATVAKAFGDDVTFYLTMNEPEVWNGEHGREVHSAPGTGNPLLLLYFFGQLVNAHRAAYRAVRAVQPKARIGVAKHQFSFVGRGFFGRLWATVCRYFWNRLFLNALVGAQDFIGIQYYQRWIFWQSEKEKKETKVSDFGWQLHPEGIYDVVKEATRYKLPIYITENGIADAQDKDRAWYITETLRALQRAIEEGADVRGHFYWSLFDNYEFVQGYTMQFGLVSIDRDHDFARTVRPSAKVYSDIIRANALPNS